MIFWLNNWNSSIHKFSQNDLIWTLLTDFCSSEGTRWAKFLHIFYCLYLIIFITQAPPPPKVIPPPPLHPYNCFTSTTATQQQLRYEDPTESQSQVSWVIVRFYRKENFHPHVGMMCLISLKSVKRNFLQDKTEIQSSTCLTSYHLFVYLCINI